MFLTSFLGRPLFTNYDWPPRNVRELQNNIERAIAIGRKDTLLLRDPISDLQLAKSAGEEALRHKELRYRLGKERLEKARVRCGGNRKRVAQHGQTDRFSVYRLIEKHLISNLREQPSY